MENNMTEISLSWHEPNANIKVNKQYKEEIQKSFHIFNRIYKNECSFKKFLKYFLKDKDKELIQNINLKFMSLNKKTS